MRQILSFGWARMANGTARAQAPSATTTVRRFVIRSPQSKPDPAPIVRTPPLRARDAVRLKRVTNSHQPRRGPPCDAIHTEPAQRIADSRRLACETGGVDSRRLVCPAL